MYIIVNKIYDENDSSAIDISFDNEFKCCYIDVYEKNDLGKLEVTNQKIKVDISEAYIERCQMFIYIYKNGESFMSKHYNISNDYNNVKPVMSVLLRDGIPCIIISKPVKTINKDYQVIAGYPKEIYEAVYKEDFTQKFESAKKRFQIDNNVKVRDSLAYIDAQLEIVTELVLCVIDCLGEAEKARVKEKNVFMEEFIDVQNKTSLLAFKTITKCLAELKEHKAKLRHLQSEYYKSRIIK